MRKKTVVSFSLICVVIAVSATAFRLRMRQIPFNSNAWQHGDAKLRFRMKDSLAAKYQAGELPTRDVIDRALGPDDDRTDAPDYRYFRLQEWYGNPWYLRVRFDDHGKVIGLAAHPD